MDQCSTHTWLPRRGLSSSLMCSPQPLLPALLPLLPRRPGQHLPDGAPPRRRQFLRHGAPASSVLPATSQLPRRPDQQQLSHHGAPAGQQLPDGAPPRRLGQQRPASNISAATAPRPAASRWRSATAPRPAAPPPRRPDQHLPDGAPPRRTASSASATVPRPAAPPQRCPGQQHLRHCAPASNKPHPAEKSTPVWLAIWRTWAGFANSQLRRAAFRSIYLYRCAHSSCFHLGAAAQTDANLSAHLHRLPTPPPYLRRMRLLPGRVRGCWVLDETFASQGLRCWVANDAASCPWRSSCKSPRARIPVLGTSGAH